MGSLDRDALDRLLDECLERGDFPGAVVIVGHRGEIVYRRAAGLRMVVPERRPMTEDTVFDLASLTKPLATAPAVLQLIEAGRLSLQDPVSRFLPGFTGEEREAVTVHYLLTHSSGLPPYHNYLDEGLSPQGIIADLCRRPLEARPGTRFIYSCLGYMLLREIVGVVSGERLDAYCRRRVFVPLGMAETMFNPPADVRERCAATEQVADRVLCGEVHDENARALEGVGGNAGLFAPADDVARFCQAVLDLLAADGPAPPLLSPAMMRRAATNQALHPGAPRGFGWDIDTDYTPVVRGDVFPPGGIGHTGFTGTSIWIDPPSRTYIVILANRCHPTREGISANIRRGVANIVGAAYAQVASTRVPGLRVQRGAGPVLTGLDRLARDGAGPFEGLRLGFITNHTSITRDYRHGIEVLRDAGADLRVLFSPEHGLRGEHDEVFTETAGRDPVSGLPVYSLYSSVQRPTGEMLEGLDALVFDIADVGVRFYTYTTTMTYCMEEAARRGMRFLVLDRPNPTNGVDIEGPVLDLAERNLAAYHRIPTRHGLTAGELARFANGEYGIGCDLTVIECEGWERAMWFDETGLPWVDPSPNMRSLTQATLYPAIGPLEAAAISVGRGTDTPFEVFGAPYVDGERLGEALNAAGIPHLRFVPLRFVPRSGKFEGQLCGGCFVFTTDRRRLRPVRAAVDIALALTRLWPEGFDVSLCRHLLGTDRATEGIRELGAPAEITAGWGADEEAFRQAREPYLIYG